MAGVSSPWHRRDYTGPGVRYMVVRNPYDRFVSMYFFVKRVHSAWLKAYDATFEMWAREFFSRPVDANPDWRLNLAGYAKEFKPDKCFDTYDLHGMIEHMNTTHGLDVPPPSDLNSTKDRLPTQEALGLLASVTRNNLDEWAREDLEFFESSL